MTAASRAAVAAAATVAAEARATGSASATTETMRSEEEKGAGNDDAASSECDGHEAMVDSIMFEFVGVSAVYGGIGDAAEWCVPTSCGVPNNTSYGVGDSESCAVEFASPSLCRLLSRSSSVSALRLFSLRLGGERSMERGETESARCSLKSDGRRSSNDDRMFAIHDGLSALGNGSHATYL